MFKVVDGVVETIESPFSNRKDGQEVIDVALEIPGQDYAKIRQVYSKQRQGQHVPLSRAFPPAGGFV